MISATRDVINFGVHAGDEQAGEAGAALHAGASPVREYTVPYSDILREIAPELRISGSVEHCPVL